MEAGPTGVSRASGGILVGRLHGPCKGAMPEGESRGVPWEWGVVIQVTSRRGEVEEKSHPLEVRTSNGWPWSGEPECAPGVVLSKAYLGW